MTFTYNSSSISTDLAKVRLLIGDTSTGDQLLQDEEINFFVDSEPSIYHAGAMACEAIAAEFSRKADKQVGDLKINASQKAEAYAKRAKKLMAMAKTRGSAGIYAGGISKTDKQTQEQDSDRVEPDFYREMHDFPGTTLNSTED